jgi:tetratricopeptide (TPR) repeat protein
LSWKSAAVFAEYASKEDAPLKDRSSKTRLQMNNFSAPIKQQYRRFFAWGYVGAILAVLFLPRLALVGGFVRVAALTSVFGAIVCAVTFWTSARIQIGQLQLRYKVVRSMSARATAIGLSLLLLQRIALRGWSVNLHESPSSTTEAAQGESVPTVKSADGIFRVDKSRLINDLRARRFSQLDQELRGYEGEAEQNIAHEENAVYAFDAFSCTSSALRPLLDEWTSKLPDSFVPHLAKAEYLYAKGWQARGSNPEVTDSQLAGMKESFAQAAHEIAAVLRLNQKVTEAYKLTISATRATDGPELGWKVTAIGLTQIPASMELRVAFMKAIEPRWGGSYDLMEKFANDSASAVRANPRIKVLAGFVDYDRGRVAVENGDYPGGIRLLTRAIEMGGDYHLFYEERGFALGLMGRFDESLDDLQHADLLWPLETANRVKMGFTLWHMGRRKDALEELDVTAQFDEPDEDAIRLRNNLARTAD